MLRGKGQNSMCASNIILYLLEIPKESTKESELIAGSCETLSKVRFLCITNEQAENGIKKPALTTRCYGLNVTCPSRARLFEHLVPSW